MSEDNNYIYTDVKDDERWIDLYGSYQTDTGLTIEQITHYIKSLLLREFSLKCCQPRTKEYSRSGNTITYFEQDRHSIELIENGIIQNISHVQYTEIAYLKKYKSYAHTHYSKLPEMRQITNKFIKICNRLFLLYYPHIANFQSDYFTNFCKHNNLSLKEFTSRHDIINHFSTFEPYIIDNKVIHWLSPEQQNDKHRETLKNEYILTYKL